MNQADQWSAIQYKALGDVGGGAALTPTATRKYQAATQASRTKSGCGSPTPLGAVVDGADLGGCGGALAGVLGQQLLHPRQMGA
jgi:hypothetical protein